MSAIYELNVYGEYECPTCHSKDVLLKYEDDNWQSGKTSSTICCACERRKLGLQGVVQWKKCTANSAMVATPEKHKIYIRWPFGYLLKWLNFRWTYRKHRKDGWCFKLIYTENFIPKTLL